MIETGGSRGERKHPPSGVGKNNRIHRGLYRCKNCGAELNADINGSRNILKMYLESLGTGRPVVAHLAVPLLRK